jgi:hypothetical protein
LHPEATLPSADTIARKLEDMYETAEQQIDELLKASTATVHHAHDAWTDPVNCNCFFGIYASYIDDDFSFQEVLNRLVHLKGQHTGVRLGEARFELFQEIGIANTVGPGTSDNAGNNVTTAERLGERLSYDLNRNMPPRNLMRCCVTSPI